MNIQFTTGNSVIQSVKTIHTHFLDPESASAGKTAQNLRLWSVGEISSKPQIMTKSSIRSEYIIVYSRHMLPSIRFLLMVHTLKKTLLIF